MNRLLASLALVFSTLTATLTASVSNAALPPPPAPQINAKAWLLVDVQSGASLAERNPDNRIEPASLTKLMTAYIAFSAMKEGRLSLNQTLPVSEKAWHAEGSRMFLDPRNPAKVEDLLKGMIVQSGNDACIVLAEALAGTEDGFAAMMNQMAKRLGMNHSHFMNATGLPHPEHYTTARDLSRLATRLIQDFPREYAAYYSLKEFSYAGITQPNRNRLLWMDPNVDGVKTGHTDSAGYCLIASTKRDNRRLLSVVLGTESDSARAMESQRLLNFGMQFYETVQLYKAQQTITTLRIFKGSNDELRAGFTKDFHITVPRGTAKLIKAQIITEQPMLAPITRGQKVGALRLTLDGKPYADYPLLALESITVAGILGRTWDSLMLMFE